MPQTLEMIRTKTPDRSEPVLRLPDAEDGAAVWELVRECKPLDENSMYCNLLQCDHFRDTCVLAELNGEVVGWISGYVPPTDGQAIFVWQVAVSPRARGYGLGKRMLKELMNRPACRGVNRMQTTITGDNDASWALFRSFAEARGAELTSAPHYERQDHFDGRHATENMVTIEFAERVKKAA